MNTLVGREKELATLENFYQSDKAEFLAIFGRRRVGKTFLIQQFYQTKSAHCFHMTGLKDGTMEDQIENFTRAIGMSFYHGAELERKKKWTHTFQQLTDAFNTLPKNRKIILFLDELPWMATKRAKLIQALDHYWNRYWSTDPRIKLIVCGSAASWMLEKLIHNKGGLYNRITYQIALSPFTLAESKKLLARNGIHINNKQATKLYMVMGGIPLYLDQVRKNLSIDQNVDKLCFTKQGLLFTEFNKLFASLFAQHTVSEEIVRIIASHHYGISQTDLMKKSSKSTGGRLKKRLQELEDAGFIDSFIPYDRKEKGIYYRVIDEYTLFFLKWIEPVTHKIKRQNKEDGYWLSKQKSHNFESWSGYVFEAVCYKHISQIHKALKLMPGVEAGTWRYVPPKKSDDTGVQIDLLFDRTDDAVTICEIKYTSSRFKIDKPYAKQLQKKINVFKAKTKTDKQIFLAIITASGLAPSMYAEELVTNVVTLDDLFE